MRIVDRIDIGGMRPIEQPTLTYLQPDAPSTSAVPQKRASISKSSAVFARQHHDELAFIRKELGGFVEKLRAEETTPVPKGCPTMPAGPGAPLVGVPGDFLPAYEKGEVSAKMDATLMPRVPHLTERERAWESSFVEQFTGDVAGTVADYRSRFVAKKDKQVFAVDAAKRLFAPWGSKKGPTNDDERRVRAEGNAALHAVATTITNLAFMQRLDELAKLDHFSPEKYVIFTAGGCGAGKGRAVKELIKGRSFGAIYDSAGEAENSDSLEKLKACLQRGIRVHMVAVYAAPTVAANRLIERAKTSGRIVDLIAFARSHVEGAENFRALMDAPELELAKQQGLVEITIMRHTGNGAIERTELETLPKPKVTTAELLQIALRELAKADKSGLPQRVLRGALTGLASRWTEYDTFFSSQSAERTP